MDKFSGTFHFPVDKMCFFVLLTVGEGRKERMIMGRLELTCFVDVDMAFFKECKKDGMCCCKKKSRMWCDTT